MPSAAGLTWIASATERAERALSQLRTAVRTTNAARLEELLIEAADELRTAANHCDDSVLSLRRKEPA